MEINKPIPNILNVYYWNKLERWINSFQGHEFITSQFNGYFYKLDWIRNGEIYQLNKYSFWDMLTYKLSEEFFMENESKISDYRDWLIKELGQPENIGIVIW